MEFDETRWRALLDAHRNAVDAMPSFALELETQQRSSQARNDLEIFKSRGATGQASARHSPDDIAAAFQHGVRELEARVTGAEDERRRVEDHAAACAAKRSALHALVDGVRAWARAQTPPIMLPGDDASALPTGFGGPMVSILQAPARAMGGGR
jgi:hypothetical protein